MTINIANPQVSTNAKDAVERVLDSGMLTAGQEVREFESEFADFVGTDYSVATSTGTAALHAMLEAAGIGDDDAVITSAFSFIASGNSIIHAGAEPLFVDVFDDTYNLKPTAVRETLQDRNNVGAILAVHLYGLPAAMKELREIADEFGILLFEDAAQAHGATYAGENAGNLADAAAFSFYPTKNMTTGEGGAITTNNEKIADRARRIIDHGRSGRYTHQTVGYNYRMTDMSAAIGRDQLENLPDWVDCRRTNADQLTDHLSDIDNVITPKTPEKREHAFHQYTIKTPDRDKIIEALDEAEIGYGIYYPETIPGQPAYGNQQGWPVAEQLTDEVISLPIHPFLDETDIDYVAQSVIEAVQ